LFGSQKAPASPGESAGGKKCLQGLKGGGRGTFLLCVGEVTQKKSPTPNPPTKTDRPVGLEKKKEQRRV